VRPQPDWLIPDDVDYLERDLGRLKSGKEAEIFLLERSYENRTCLLAHKRYRPRSISHKGELEALGFERVNLFMNDHAYREGRTFSKSRDRRAAERKTKYGKRLLSQGWSGNELDVLRRAWAAGVTVPYPLGERGDGLVMQFLGGADAAAPRLAQARLSRPELKEAFDQLAGNLRALVGAGLVHADLSAFNLLWWQDQVWLIDFPQAVDVAVNPQAFEFLRRDVDNVSTWFGRHGLDVDARDLFAELVTMAG
jgi:RIO kinase 1